MCYLSNDTSLYVSVAYNTNITFTLILKRIQTGVDQKSIKSKSSIQYFKHQPYSWSTMNEQLVYYISELDIIIDQSYNGLRLEVLVFLSLGTGLVINWYQNMTPLFMLMLIAYIPHCRFFSNFNPLVNYKNRKIRKGRNESVH